LALWWRGHKSIGSNSVSTAISKARNSLQWLRSTSAVRAARNALLWREFCTAEDCNIFWGVHATFAEAAAKAPPTKPLGYDNPEPAAMYRNFLNRVGPNEYAVLHWVRRALPSGGRVFDFGGHVGVKYYALRTVDGLPAQLDWTVYDVAAVVQAGRKLAERRGVSDLHFTERFEDASGVDVFLALGSLQYVEPSLAEHLQRLDALPRMVLVSSTPMVDGPRYVTLQNIGTAFCPYLIEDRGALVAGMDQLGYALCHSWTNPEKECVIMDQPEKSVHGYTSLHFELRSSKEAVP
jgi:putative methyltransferase (TIGR04325 family)